MYLCGSIEATIMNRTNHFVLVLLATVMFAAVGCSKFRDNRQYDTTLEHGIAESSFFSIFRYIEQETGASAGLVSEPCLTVTGDYSTFPATLVYDFGDTACVDIFDIKHKGGFTAVYSDNWNTTGATVTITTQNLQIKGYDVTGTLTLTNLGVNNEGDREISFVVTNAVVNVTDVVSSAWYCDYVLTLTDLNNAELIHDDVYTVTGTAGGVNDDGRNFTVEITEPLIKEQICRWNRAGRVKISIEDLKDREVFYGKDYCFDNVDCCDNEADISIDGKKDKTIRMR